MRRSSLLVAVAALSTTSSSALAQTTPSGAEDAAEQPLSAPAVAPSPRAAEAPHAEVRDYVWVGVAGLATFGASWIGTIIVAAATDPPDKGLAVGHAAVPVGGPFLSLAEGSHAEDIQGVLAGLGALQGAGVAAALLGFTLESKVEVGGTAAWVTPAVAPAGIGVTGRF